MFYSVQNQSGEKSFNLFISYHQMPHYRGPVIRALGKRAKLTVVANLNEIDGIKPIKKNLQGVKFIVSRLYYLTSKIIWQSEVISSVLSSPSDSRFIFLGNFLHLSSWIAVVCCRLKRRPVFFWTHGVVRREVGLRRAVRYLFYRLANGILLYGPWAKRQLIDWGIQGGKIKVIYNSLDYEAIKKNRAICYDASLSSNCVKKEYSVCFIGRLTKVKKVDLLLRSIAEIQKRSDFRISVIIIGDGECRQALMEIANSMKVNVSFLGALYDEHEIGKWVYNSHACISPGNVGLSAVHSLSYGTPVITERERNGQMPEAECVIEGVTGFLFDGNREGDLGIVLERALPIINEKRDRFRRNCIAVIERFYTPEGQAELILNAIS